MHRILLAVIFLCLGGFLVAQPEATEMTVERRNRTSLPAGAQRLPEFINSSFEESAPLISADGNVLYFTRRKHPQNFGLSKAGDIWVSHRSSTGQWSRAVHAGAPLNNIYHNAAVALDPGKQIIYLENTYGDFSEGLAQAVREGRSWSSPQGCHIEDYYTMGDGATFHLCADGNRLIMALERQDGQGRRDLYVSFRQDELSWSAPLNLGPVINTAREETRAFLAADARTLYFASRGHGGSGDFDLFMSRRLDDSWTNWSPPQNLGPTVNTPDDDLYISLPAIGNPAYLTYRDSGSTSIYTVPLPEDLRPEPVKLVLGRVNLPEQPQGPLQVTSLDLREKSAPRQLPLTKEGTFALVVGPGEEVGIQVDAPGYFPVSTYVKGQGGATSAETDQGPLLASTEFSPDYLQRDGEIRHLKLRLDQIDEELAVMRRQREAYQRELQLKTPSPGASVYSDPELDALRHRYQELNRPVVIDTVPIPHSYDWNPKGGSLIPEKDARRGTPDDELAEMKKRFNQFYQPGQQADAAKEEEAYLWDTAKGFSDFREEVQRKMAREMQPQVGRALTEELWPQVKASVQEGLSPDLLVILDEKEYQIREQVSRQLEDAAIQVGQSKIEMPDWQRELEGSLREKMRPEVEAELKMQLREDVRSALANEARYQVRRQEADRLNDLMNEKVRQQVMEEQERFGGGSPELRDLRVKGVAPSPAAYQEEEREFVLLRPERGAVFTLNNVFFKPNTSQLKDVSYLELDRVVAFLVAHPDLNVEIAAHTNGWLSHSISLELSEQRAAAVADYLFNRGVSPLQVTYKGYGKTSPIASNDTLEGRRKNQRIELRMLEN